MTTGRALELVIDHLVSTGPHERQIERAIRHLDARRAKIEERRIIQFHRREAKRRERDTQIS